MFRSILRDQSCLLILLVLIPEKFLESPILPREIDLDRLVPKHKKTRASKFSAKQNGRIKKAPRIKPPFCAPGFGTRKSVLADILKGLIKTQQGTNRQMPFLGYDKTVIPLSDGVNVSVELTIQVFSLYNIALIADVYDTLQFKLGYFNYQRDYGLIYCGCLVFTNLVWHTINNNYNPTQNRIQFKK